jgi:hypothetical protein
MRLSEIIKKLEAHFPPEQVKVLSGILEGQQEEEQRKIEEMGKALTSIVSDMNNYSFRMSSAFEVG